MGPHHLNNKKSQLLEESTLVPREFYLLLTGTPLHNSIEDIWEFLNYSDSDTFESKEALVGKMGNLLMLCAGKLPAHIP